MRSHRSLLQVYVGLAAARSGPKLFCPTIVALGGVGRVCLGWLQIIQVLEADGHRDRFMM
jgi:hypothetical protein